MTKRAGNPLQSSDNGITYSPGLGFVPGNLGRPVAHQICIASNILCLILLAQPLCQSMFSLPATYLGKLLGLRIIINHSSKMIIMSDPIRLMIQYGSELFSFLVVFLLIRFAFFQQLSVARIFRRPQKGILSIALPVMAACSVLAVVLAKGLQLLLNTIGIVLDTLPDAVQALTPDVWVTLGGSLAIGLLQELIFRGVLLAPLRRFGDSFAIIAAALLAAVTSGGLITGVAVFLYGIVAGYFVIRSGSVYTALTGRVLCTLLLFAIQTARGLLEYSLGDVVILVAVLVILLLAILAFIRFLRLDRQAFHLLPASPLLPMGYRLQVFCTSLFFLIQGGLLVFRMLQSLQIIGW